MHASSLVQVRRHRHNTDTSGAQKLGCSWSSRSCSTCQACVARRAKNAVSAPQLRPCATYAVDFGPHSARRVASRSLMASCTYMTSACTVVLVSRAQCAQVCCGSRLTQKKGMNHSEQAVKVNAGPDTALSIRFSKHQGRSRSCYRSRCTHRARYVSHWQACLKGARPGAHHKLSQRQRAAATLPSSGPTSAPPRATPRLRCSHMLELASVNGTRCACSALHHAHIVSCQASCTGHAIEKRHVTSHFEAAGHRLCAT